MIINQFHSGTAPGDAITNDMLEIQEFLLENGHQSHIFAEYVHPKLKDKVNSIFSYTGESEEVLIVHHSMGINCFDLIAKIPSRKILIYHNITPPSFFEGINDHVIPHLLKGKKQLKDYLDIVEFAFADSEYNKKDLVESGYTNADVLPILLNFQSYESETNDKLYKKYKDTKNILFVGRISPNKCQKDVIRAFYSYHKYENKDSRLFLIGGYDGLESYYEELLEFAQTLGISEHVFIPGKVSFKDLCTYYRLADIFLCMSEHEGFCVPVLESFHFGLPVIAYNSTALPYTMGEAGILVEKKDYRLIGTLLDEIIKNEELRKRIVKKQKERLHDFDREILGKKLLDRVSKKEKFSYVAKRTIEVKGRFETTYSLAVVNRNIALALSKDNDVSVYACDGNGDYEPNPKDLLDKKDVWKLWEKSKTPRVYDFEIRNMYPPRVDDMEGIYNILNFAWEDSILPPEYVKAFNTFLDGLIVPSVFVKNVLIDSGVHVPIRVVNNGVEQDILDPHIPPYQLNTKKSFRFLHISSGFPRKGTDVLLRAYFEEFSEDDDVVLIIKTFPNIHNKVAEEIQREIKRTGKRPEIVHIDRDVDRKDYVGIVKASSCAVFPVRAEGFCIPAGEAMLAKKPLIITGYSGHVDFCDAKTAFIIPYKLVCSGSHVNSGSAKWAEPDMGALRDSMRFVFENYSEKQVKERVDRAYKNIKENFSWEVSAQKCTSFLEDMEKKAPRRTRIGMITSWETRCGVAEYSKYLVHSLYKQDKLHFFIFPPQTPSYHEKKRGRLTVTPCWETIKSESISNLIKEIRQKRIDVVVIQFQFALLSKEALASLVQTLKALSIRVYIIFHTIHLGGKKMTFKPIAPILKEADGLLMHSKDNIEEFRKMGLESLLFPHGCLSFPDEEKGMIRKKLKLESKKPVISSFGFILPHKGFLETIEAVGILKNEFPDILYLMVCSVHPDPISQEHFNLCREKIKQLKLKNNVLMFPDYLKEEEINTLLHASDMLVMPYKETSESCSGAVRFALSALRPAIVTKNPIFDDVSDAVFFIEKCSPKQIAEGVRSLYADSKMRSELAKNAEEYIRKNSFENMGKVLVDLIS